MIALVLSCRTPRYQYKSRGNDFDIFFFRYDSALGDFDKTMVNLRGNPFIDYKQLGLQYKLYACEVRQKGSYAWKNLIMNAFLCLKLQHHFNK